MIVCVKRNTSDMIPLVVLFSIFQAVICAQERNFGGERVVDNLLQNYGESQQLVRPSVNTSASLGLTLAAIRSFDDRSGLLTGTYWLKQQWTDERVGWEDKSVASVNFPITKLWRPDFKIFNNLDFEENIDTVASPIVYQSGMVLWIPPAEYTTRCIAPTDDTDEWTCKLKAGSWTHSALEINLSVYENRTTIDIDDYKPELNGWNVTPLDTEVEHKYYDCCPNVPYTSITFQFKISKIDGGVADAAVATRSLSVFSLSAIMLLVKSAF